MLLFPPGKINLGLRVLAKRGDGYHVIETCMVPIPLVDILEIVASEAFQFTQQGREIEGAPEDNLVVKAYALLNEKFQLPPISINLVKNIPMGAGLGGGSADATYMLRALVSMFQLPISPFELHSLAAQLGSDCPFFLEDRPQLATGRGEILAPLEVDLSGLYIKLIYPEIHVSTAEAYAGVTFSHPDELSVMDVLKFPRSEWKGLLTNAFEHSVFQQHRELEVIKTHLYNEGAFYASMSGSGSTMFGLYTEEPTLTYPNYFERILKF